MKFIKIFCLFSLIVLVGCKETKIEEKIVTETVTMEVEKPVLTVSQQNGICEVQSRCYVMKLNIPKEGTEKINFGFSRTPEEANLIINNESFTLDELGSIEIDLLEADNVILEIRQDTDENLDIWLDGYTVNETYYDFDGHIWEVNFKYQKPELHFGIKQITKNVQQQVNSVAFQLFGKNNIENLYQADVYTEDGCLIGSGDVGRYGSTSIVEIFFTNQCHDNVYFTSLDEERNYIVRFLSITGEPTWNVIHEGVSLVDTHYYDTSYRGSHYNRKPSVNRKFTQLHLESPYFTPDSWKDTPAFIFDSIEIEVEIDGDYYIEFDSEACPEFECSGRKGEVFTSIDGKISIDYLWVRYNSDLTITLYNTEPTRVNFEITDCNITDSNWEVFFTCPFKTK